MKKSRKILLEHIPDFLNYCGIEKGLSGRTQQNYERFLNKFVSWAKSKKLGNLLPHQLTPEHVRDYRLYLSHCIGSKTKKFLRRDTQSYYLIALRALLSYFMARDVVSILPSKIALPKADKSEKTAKLFSVEQLERLLNLPDIRFGKS